MQVPAQWLSSRGEMIHDLDTDQTNGLIREKRVELIRADLLGRCSSYFDLPVFIQWVAPETCRFMRMKLNLAS